MPVVALEPRKLEASLSITSVRFFEDQPQTLVLGVKNQSVKIHDLRGMCSVILAPVCFLTIFQIRTRQSLLSRLDVTTTLPSTMLTQTISPPVPDLILDLHSLGFTLDYGVCVHKNMNFADFLTHGIALRNYKGIPLMRIGIMPPVLPVVPPIFLQIRWIIYLTVDIIDYPHRCFWDKHFCYFIMYFAGCHYFTLLILLLCVISSILDKDIVCLHLRQKKPHALTSLLITPYRINPPQSLWNRGNL